MPLKAQQPPSEVAALAVAVKGHAQKARFSRRYWAVKEVREPGPYTGRRRAQGGQALTA